MTVFFILYSTNLCYDIGVSNNNQLVVTDRYPDEPSFVLPKCLK
eukprot:CAMPEP_0176486988 /NCGR_PEP_ID=MMETSP0200_2-20121128/5873_1 /TAXON_ID=947934 /ORGANISM="Chaetoceros sp., Strain GSL56" /LENGTH=43 /DNA_ID= /DNA_START= /DNA_END= /DNA_ORIENTATION=